MESPSKRSHVQQDHASPARDPQDQRGTLSPQIDPELKAKLANRPLHARFSVSQGYQSPPKRALGFTRSEPLLDLQTTNKTLHDVFTRDDSMQKVPLTGSPHGLQESFRLHTPAESPKKRGMEQEEDDGDGMHVDDSPTQQRQVRALPKRKEKEKDDFDMDADF